MKAKETEKEPVVLPELDNYFKTKTRYVSKRVVLIILAVLMAAGMSYLTFIHPNAVRYWYSKQKMPEFQLDSPWLAEYTGRARLLKEDGSLLYEGSIANAVIEGTGTLYKDGYTLYTGEFSQNMYNGKGKLFAEYEVLVYEGEFADNLYNGFGVLYNDREQVEYSGEFADGMYHGKGTLSYKLDGRGFKYIGEFELGIPSGSGRLFRDGELWYDGEFSDGEFSGFGKEYKNGELIYAGEFADGLYEGLGKFYVKNVLAYEGGFMHGLYNGDGIEYNPETGFKKYEGKFSNGSYMPSGTVFDENGNPIKEVITPFDPLSLIGVKYLEAIVLLADAGINYRVQNLDERHLLIDDASGNIYSLSLDKQSKEPDAVIEIYFCSLSAVGDIIVGMDAPIEISGESENNEKNVGTEEALMGEGLEPAAEFALIMSNLYWGREVEKGSLLSYDVVRGRMLVTVFYIMQEIKGDTDNENRIDEGDAETTDLPEIKEDTVIEEENEIADRFEIDSQVSENEEETYDLKEVEVEIEALEDNKTGDDMRTKTKAGKILFIKTQTLTEENKPKEKIPVSGGK